MDTEILLKVEQIGVEIVVFTVTQEGIFYANTHGRGTKGHKTLEGCSKEVAKWYNQDDTDGAFSAELSPEMSREEFFIKYKKQIYGED